MKFQELEQYKGETDWEFCWRCICAKIEGTINCDWQDIVEEFDLPLHRDSLRKAVNVGDFSAYKVAQHYEQKLQKLAKEKQPKAEKELDDKVHQLQKEKMKLKDERSALNAKLRLQARWEVLLETIEEAVKTVDTKKYLNHNKDFIKTHEENEAVLMISDIHIGMTIDNELNKFNKEICVQRFNKLVKSTVANCQRNNITTLNVVLGGDIIEGIINISGRIQQNENVVEQIFTGAELMTEVIVNLSKHIKQVNVWSVNGNHARMSKDTKEALDGESFETMLYEYIKMKIALLSHKIDLSNVKLNDNDYPDMAIIKIKNCGKTVAASHGTKDKKAIHNVSRINSFLPITIDYYMMGHLHNSHHQYNCYVNGCLSGSNEYAQGLRYNNDPVQIMLVFFEDGSTTLCEMNLKE